jgi:hypothetical protein
MMFCLKCKPGSSEASELEAPLKNPNYMFGFLYFIAYALSIYYLFQKIRSLLRWRIS